MLLFIFHKNHIASLRSGITYSTTEQGSVFKNFQQYLIAKLRKKREKNKTNSFVFSSECQVSSS